MLKIVVLYKKCFIILWYENLIYIYIQKLVYLLPMRKH